MRSLGSGDFGVEKRGEMRNRNRSLVVGLILSVVLVVAAMPAGSTRPGKPRDDEVRSANLRLVGATGDNRPAVTFGEAFFTDAAFQDDYAYQGTWNGGFRIVDISRPRKPRAVAEVDCGTFQGDIGVYKNLVFRSIDTPTAATTPEETCDAPAGSVGLRGHPDLRGPQG